MQTINQKNRSEVLPKRNFDCVDVDHETNLSEGGMKNGSLAIFLLGSAGYKLKKKA